MEIESKEAEKTEAKVDTLVSKKDTSEAVESLIVSEYARQSISLSSEVIDMIADRVAEKIAEKIIVNFLPRSSEASPIWSWKEWSENNWNKFLTIYKL